MSRRSISRKLLGVIFWAWGLLPGVSGAEPSVSGQLPPQFAASPAYGTEILKIILYLSCLIGGLLLLRAWLRRPRWSQGRPSRSKPIQVVSQQFLDTRKSLIVVEVEGRRLLLASVADRLDMLLELGWKPGAASRDSEGGAGTLEQFGLEEKKIHASTV